MPELSFEQLLRANHIRATPQRLAILKIIHNACEHLSPGEVYNIAREKLPGINEATVYRTLDFFYKRGLLLCAHTGESKFEYEIAEPHHHLVCQKCDRTIVIDHQRLVDFFSQIEAETGFRIETHHLTFTGICDNCKKG
jgi:Fe2+ or Zn2+ uptake regulation protein